MVLFITDDDSEDIFSEMLDRNKNKSGKVQMELEGTVYLIHSNTAAYERELKRNCPRRTDLEIPMLLLLLLMMMLLPLFKYTQIAETL